MKNDYSQIKRKIFLRSFLIVAGAGVACILVVLLLVNVIFGEPVSEFVVRLFINTLNLNRESAISLYNNVFRYHQIIWIMLCFCVMLIISFNIGMNRFIRYFGEISAGLDKLMQGDYKEIYLSDEMGFMEQKLNTVMYALEKQAKDAQTAEQRKNDLIVYLAHDIKTPLTSIIGYLNLLREAPEMRMEQRAKYTEITLEKAYRLEQLINEFFEITRFNLQSVVLNKEEVDLTRLLEQVSDEFYPILETQKKTLSISAPEHLMVFADGDKLARVFNNILKNAAAYSYYNTEIRFSANKAQEGVVITCSNHGETIPQAKLGSIFEKFYRIDPSRGTEKGGVGLGLAIAKEIVTAHGGEVYATSLDEKTVFTVILPEPA